MATAKPTQKAGPATVGLQVVSAREGFRRAGYTFGREPRVIPLCDLSAEQVEQITSDPALVAVQVEIAPAKAE